MLFDVRVGTAAAVAHAQAGGVRTRLPKPLLPSSSPFLLFLGNSIVIVQEAGGRGGRGEEQADDDIENDEAAMSLDLKPFSAAFCFHVSSKTSYESPAAPYSQN